MIRKLSDIVFRQIKKADFHGELDDEALLYGVKILVSSGMSILIALLIGIMFQKTPGVILFLVTYIMIRSQTSGLHMNSYEKCCILFQLIICAVLIMETYNGSYRKLLTVLYGVFSILIIPVVPVETKNNPMPDSMRSLKKKMSIRVCLMFFFFLVLGNQYPMTYYIAMAGIVNHVLVIIASITLWFQSQEETKDE